LRAGQRGPIVNARPEGKVELSDRNKNAAVPPSEAEQTRAARIGGVLFRNRSWLPVPFVLVLLLAPGSITITRSVVAACLIALGQGWRLLAVAVAGAVTRRRGRRVQELVSNGPFAWHRNPLYVGNLILWMGVVLFSGVLWFLPVTALLFALEYHYIVRYEEGVLESFFGPQYLAYKARTPRWLPDLRAPVGRPELRWYEALRSESSTFLQYAALLIVFIGKQYWLYPR